MKSAVCAIKIYVLGISHGKKALFRSNRVANFQFCKKFKNQMISRIENPADCGFSIVDSMSHLIFGFLTIEPSKSGIG